MEDRKVKAKNPWMKFFILAKDNKDDLERSQIETRVKFRNTYKVPNKFLKLTKDN